MQEKYVTMRDIAQKMGLSRSTVSFVLNDRYDGIRISDEVRSKIKKAAKEMGYCRNAVVQSLVSGRTRHIAFVTRGKSTYEYQSRVINGFINSLTEKHFSIQFFCTEDAKIEETFQNIVEQRIEGIATYLIGDTLELFLRKGKERNIPVVVFDHSILFNSGIYVKSDDMQGTRDSVKYLQSIGHRHIGYFGLGGGCGQRQQAFFDAVKEFDIINHDEDNRFSSNHLEQRKMVDELLSRSAAERPTAYCCASDYIAAIMEFGAARQGLKIPEDLSVIGFSDLQDVALIHPGLTTVHQDFEQEGQVAADLLIKEIERKKRISFNAPVAMQVKTKLLVRDTTMPLPNN